MCYHIYYISLSLYIYIYMYIHICVYIYIYISTATATADLSNSRLRKFRSRRRTNLESLNSRPRPSDLSYGLEMLFVEIKTLKPEVQTYQVRNWPHGIPRLGGATIQPHP